VAGAAPAVLSRAMGLIDYFMVIFAGITIGAATLAHVFS
jgi:hypothetical protein